MKTKPVCESVFPWLKANLGNESLAVLTGTDRRALMAAVQIVELNAYDSCQSNIDAFGDIVRRMQPSARELAYHAIAHVSDWSDRNRIWESAGLDPIANPRVCQFE